MRDLWHVVESHGEQLAVVDALKASVQQLRRELTELTKEVDSLARKR